MIFLAAFASVLLEKHALSIFSSLLVDTLDCYVRFIFFCLFCCNLVLGGLFFDDYE